MTGEMGILAVIVETLGAPGLLLLCMGAPTFVMAFMYADHRRYERERLRAVHVEAEKQARFVADQTRAATEHKADLYRMESQYTAIITQQEKRFEIVVKNYDNNIALVESYQKLSNELAGIIHMSTQVMTKLVEKIDNNMFCPITRKGVDK